MTSVSIHIPTLEQLEIFLLACVLHTVLCKISKHFPPGRYLPPLEDSGIVLIWAMAGWSYGAGVEGILWWAITVALLFALLLIRKYGYWGDRR